MGNILAKTCSKKFFLGAALCAFAAGTASAAATTHTDYVLTSGAQTFTGENIFVTGTQGQSAEACQYVGGKVGEPASNYDAGKNAYSRGDYSISFNQILRVSAMRFSRTRER